MEVQVEKRGLDKDEAVPNSQGSESERQCAGPFGVISKCLSVTGK